MQLFSTIAQLILEIGHFSEGDATIGKTVVLAVFSGSYDRLDISTTVFFAVVDELVWIGGWAGRWWARVFTGDYIVTFDLWGWTIYGWGRAGITWTRTVYNNSRTIYFWRTATYFWWRAMRPWRRAVDLFLTYIVARFIEYASF